MFNFKVVTVGGTAKIKSMLAPETGRGLAAGPCGILIDKSAPENWGRFGRRELSTIKCDKSRPWVGTPTCAISEAILP